MKTIATLTVNPALDVFLEVPNLIPEHKLRSLRPVYVAGGGGINVSRAIRNLGGTSTALFLAGGSTGDRMIQLLQRDLIDVRPIKTIEPTREDFNILDRATAHEYRIIVPGPDVAKPEWEQLLIALQSLTPRPDYVVASGSLPPGVPIDFYARVAALAEEMNFRLIVDTSGEALRNAGAKGTYLLKPNVGELSYAAGEQVLKDVLIESAANAIIAAEHSKVVIVSAGAAGAVLVDRNGARRIPAPVVRVASRIGAGDSMVAGIVLALARGLSIDDATRFGVAAGTAAVMAAGHHLCRCEDTERLFEEMRREVTAAA